MTGLQAPPDQQTIPVVDPFTGEKIGSIPVGSAEAASTAVRAARAVLDGVCEAIGAGARTRPAAARQAGP